MITRDVISVRLIRTSQPIPGYPAAAPGLELWRVEWTKRLRNGVEDEQRHEHHTEESVRRHVRNLVAQRPEGMSVDDVYSEDI